MQELLFGRYFEVAINSLRDDFKYNMNMNEI